MKKSVIASLVGVGCGLFISLYAPASEASAMTAPVRHGITATTLTMRCTNCCYQCGTGGTCANNGDAVKCTWEAGSCSTWGLCL